MTYNHEEAKVLCPAAAKEVERLRDISLSREEILTIMYCIECIQPRDALDESGVEHAWKIHSRLQKIIYGIPSTKDIEQ